MLMRFRLHLSLGFAITTFLGTVYSERAPAIQETSKPQMCCPIVELRQYTLHPGQRDVLIELFDREFVETQEGVGMSIIGQFRDLDKPDRFVWLRGFPDMPSRARSLEEFYGGPVWKTHSKVANATMIDASNVLLLRPARAASGFSITNSARPQIGGKEVDGGLVIATIYYFSAPVSQDFVEFFERTLKPITKRNGAGVDAYFVTESSRNTFPKLPVREGEYVFVWFMRFADQPSYERYRDALARSEAWRTKVEPVLARNLKGAPEILKLSPTARSLWRNANSAQADNK
jgi:NIPSNAP protein